MGNCSLLLRPTTPGNVYYDGTPQMMKAYKNIVEAYVGS
jgi:hypothetical protein